jgi:hypothetical protein
MRHLLLPVLGAILSALLFSPQAAADIGDNAAGINVHLPHASLHLVDKAADLGVTWIRVDGNWEVFEPRRGVFQTQLMDRVVCRAHEQGLKVYMTLAYTPCWAVEGNRVNCSDPNRPYSGYLRPAAGEYEAFVGRAVSHYAAGIPCGNDTATVTHFGIWNEANLEQFYENGDTADYATRILVPGARAVHSACPSCKVLGPDLANVGEADVKLEQVLCNGAALQGIDILTHHSYNSFEELGHFIWDGDSYDNVLDEQRFPWTRKSLRQIMETCGALDLEVWMTETGLRAADPNNAEELADQATYVRLVLEAQARRPWITNTFLYEIVDDVRSDIDGYGLYRCEQTDQGHREPCLTKPAGGALRDFLAAHPGWGEEAPQVAECANGLDDDEDGLVDLEDPGCANAEDRDEYNPPPPPQIEVPRSPRLDVDGEPDEYGVDAVLLLGPSDFEATEGPAELPEIADLSASIRVRRFGDRLGFFVEVSDDVHDNDKAPADIWQGDSLQIAWDRNGDGGEGYGADDVELGLALTDGAVWHTFQGTEPDLEGPVIVRSGGTTRYEFSLPLAAVFAGRQEARMGLLINEADDAGREGWLAFAGGIGRFKRPADFGVLRLVDRLDDPDPQVADPGPDAGDAGMDVEELDASVGDTDVGSDLGSDLSASDTPDADGPSDGPGADAADRPDTPSLDDEVGDQEMLGCACKVGSRRAGPLWSLLRRR